MTATAPALPSPGPLPCSPCPEWLREIVQQITDEIAARNVLDALDDEGGEDE